MKNKIFIFSFLVLMGGLFSGCASFFTGGVAGYEVNAGSAKADVDVSYARAYDASLETIRAMYGISEDNKGQGWVKTQLHHHYVTVHIEKLHEGAVRITVSARRYAVLKAQYARDVLARIIERIKQQPLWLR